MTERLPRGVPSKRSQCEKCRRRVDEVTVVISPRLASVIDGWRPEGHVPRMLDGNRPLQLCERCYGVEERRFCRENHTKPRPFVAQLGLAL